MKIFKFSSKCQESFEDVILLSLGGGGIRCTVYTGNLIETVEHLLDTEYRPMVNHAGLNIIESLLDLRKTLLSVKSICDSNLALNSTCDPDITLFLGVYEKQIQL